MLKGLDLFLFVDLPLFVGPNPLFVLCKKKKWR